MYIFVCIVDLISAVLLSISSLSQSKYDKQHQSTVKDAFKIKQNVPVGNDSVFTTRKSMFSLVLFGCMSFLFCGVNSSFGQFIPLLTADVLKQSFLQVTLTSILFHGIQCCGLIVCLISFRYNRPFAMLSTNTTLLLSGTLLVILGVPSSEAAWFVSVVLIALGSSGVYCHCINIAFRILPLNREYSR